MSDKKQSSIKWLIEQLKERGYAYDFSTHLLFEQAKEMHNKEIVDAHVNGNKEYTIGGGYELIAEHYYNETFGDGKND